MRRIIVSGSLGALWAGQLAVAAPVAMLTEVHGTVRLTVKGKTSKATLMKAVSTGDTIETKAGAKATVVFFGSGSRQQLQPDSKAVVQAEGLKLQAGPQPKRLPKIDVKAAKRLASARVGKGRGGGVLMRGGPGQVQLEPRALFDTSILEGRPTFRWAAEEGDANYEVLVYDTDDALIWSGRTKERSLVYPADAPALKPGQKYFWELEARRGRRRPTVISGVFTLLDEPAAKAVRDETAGLMGGGNPDSTTLLLLASLYAEHSLWDDALRTYERLVKGFPDDEALATRLRDLRKEQGQTVEEPETD